LVHDFLAPEFHYHEFFRVNLILINVDFPTAYVLSANFNCFPDHLWNHPMPQC